MNKSKINLTLNFVIPNQLIIALDYLIKNII